MDERKRMRYASKRDPPRERVQQQQPAPAKKLKFRGAPALPLHACYAPAGRRDRLKAACTRHAGTKMQMKPGELVHAGSAIPDAANAELFSPADASSFQGLGLTQALADHLEGVLTARCALHGTQKEGTVPVPGHAPCRA